MIKAKTAKRKEQEFNRDLWIRLSIKRLSKAIDREASRGNNLVKIDIREITMGTENLAEIGEMCTLIDKELAANDYTTHYSIDGELTISW